MIDQYIRIHGKRLYGLCLTLCANTFDAEDLYQDTWLKVLKNVSQYDPAQAFEPWLTKICVNTYRNSLRRLMRSPIFTAFPTEEAKRQVFEQAAAPEKEDYSDLYQAINRLPEKLRTTVILYYFEDMDTNAVAQILKVPPGTIKSRLSKARKLLKEVLTDEANL